MVEKTRRGLPPPPEGEPRILDKAWQTAATELSPAVSTSALSIGEVVCGKYKVLKKLGEGSFGQVYKAKEEVTQRLVALKTFRENFYGHRITIEFISTELKAACRIKHENVVLIYTVETLPNKRPLMVMEYLDGEPLDEMLKRRGRFPWSEAKELIIQILKGLEAIHKERVVHRDLKPPNCIYIEASRKIKIFDFGIARILQGESYERKQTRQAGTPGYMAPEQYKGVGVDTRCDIYAVGVMLFELLTGRVFDGEAPTPLAFELPTQDIPYAVDSIIKKAVQRDKRNRYRTAKEFRLDIEATVSPDLESSVLALTHSHRETPQKNISLNPQASSSQILSSAQEIASPRGEVPLVSKQTASTLFRPPPSANMK